ncbi:TRAP transporter small permease [Tepidamorphus sp. 3E244]|uniref:TRAP transporter small permease n=1 Tax=Tepidamorphus sp. 3E244 TaxID=3385498 RepID=UPI0038FCB8EC
MIAFSRFSLALAWGAAALFTLAGVMLTYEVVARYFFTKPTIWAAELSQLCLIWGSLIAMGWALSNRRHIRVTAITSLLGHGPQRALELFAMVAVALFSAIVVWKGFDIFYDSFERGRTTGSLLNLPSWVAELSVPFGFAVLFVQSLVESVRLLRGDFIPADKVPNE